MFYADREMEHFDIYTTTDRFYGEKDSARDFRLYATNDVLKRKIWLTHLTTARMQCSKYDKKLFFGKASPLLALEHLAATRTLSELREIFFGVLSQYKTRATSENWWPPKAPLDLH